MPKGLTEKARSRVSQTQTFYFNNRHANALKEKRAQRACRYYKRTRLWDRARQVAKVVLRESSLSKREALTKNTKQKIWKKSKKWFQKNLMNHKLKFRTFFAELRSNQLSGQTGDLLNCRKSSKYFRILANQQIRVATLNVRGLNQPTKKESLIHIMKEHGYEILLMTETNVNIGCVETWDGYTVFYSTSIDQKIRERERNKRENAVASGARQLDPGTSHRLAEDFEHAGVGIVIKNSLINSVKHVRQRNGRIISITFSCSGYDVTMICAYAPHSGHATETKEEFYADLSEEIACCHGRFYVGGDFNARIHYVREHDTVVCGPFILGRGMEYLNTMNEQTKESRALFLGWCKMHHLSILNSQASSRNLLKNYLLIKKNSTVLILDLLLMLNGMRKSITG